MAEKDPEIKGYLNSEIKIAGLVKKSKPTVEYTNLTRARELIDLLHVLMESGVFRATLAR